MLTDGESAAVCATCMGCGRVSQDQFGRYVPQPTWTDSNSTAAGWTHCPRCLGSGMIVVNKGRFTSAPSS